MVYPFKRADGWCKSVKVNDGIQFSMFLLKKEPALFGYKRQVRHHSRTWVAPRIQLFRPKQISLRMK